MLWVPVWIASTCRCNSNGYPRYILLQRKPKKKKKKKTSHNHLLMRKCAVIRSNTVRSAAPDLGLYCLSITLLGVSWVQWVNMNHLLMRKCAVIRSNTVRSAAPDLGLYCLSITLLGVSWVQWVNMTLSSVYVFYPLDIIWTSARQNL